MNKKLLIILIAILGFSILGIIVWIVIKSKIKQIDSTNNKTIQTSIDKQTTQKTNNPASTITIEYWGLWEPTSVMQPIIDSYEATHPGIKIKYVQKSFYKYEETVLTRIQQSSTSGTPTPDIIRIHSSWVPEFQKYLSPLPENIMNTDEYSKAFYPFVKSAAMGNDGNIYALPIEIDGLALYYNKNLLKQAGYDKPPLYWDEIEEAAKKLTKRDKQGKIIQAGLAMGTAKNIMHSEEILYLLFLQNNAQISNLNGTVKLTDNSRATNALDYYVQYTLEDKVWADYLPSDVEMFASGKLAMMIAPSWRVFDIIAMNPKIEFDLAPVPQLNSQFETQRDYATFWMEAVPANSPHQQEAWEFLKYLTEEKQLKQLYSNISQTIRAFGEPYPRPDMAEDLKDEPYVGTIIKSAPIMEVLKFKTPKAVNTAINQAITDVSSKNANSAEALENAQKYIDKYQQGL